MTKRPGAAVTGGALLALLCPGAGSAVAQGTPDTHDALALPRAVSGGYASWTTTDAQPTDHGMSIDVTEPAVRGSMDRAWFPATGGSTNPETGAVEVELGGAARFVPSAGSAPPLTLGGLRLRLADKGDNSGNSGALYARTTADGEAREVMLADVAASDAGPAVRAGGVTWTGLRASLTDEGARLLEEWSGQSFAEGDGLGLLDVTVGTGSRTAPAPTDSNPPAAAPAPAPATTAPQEPKQSPPSAAVGVEELTAGGEQTVTGAGFAPGEVVLVTIDGDTRYQAVADDAGRISRTFPVYSTATEGAHTVEISTVTGERRAAVDFGVRAPA